MKNYKIYIYDRFLVTPIKSGADTISVYIYIMLSIDRKKRYFATSLYAQNHYGKYVELDKSFYHDGLSQEDFYSFKNYYMQIEQDFLTYITTTIDTKDKLDSFIQRLENPKFVFHPKLLNVFSQNELEGYFQKDEDNILLDIKDVSKFKPRQIDGWLNEEVEVSTDLDDNDFPLLEDREGNIILPEEFRKRYF